MDEELQLHQYVPMPHPNNMAAIDLHTSPETQNCANFTRHVLACTWGIWLPLLLGEHRCWDIQLYNIKHIHNETRRQIKLNTSPKQFETEQSKLENYGAW